MKKLKLYEDFLNESDAYAISRMSNDIGLGPAQDFLDSHNVNIELLKKDISQGTINRYDLRDIIRGNAPSSKIKKFIKTYVNESVVTESVFAFKPDNIEQLHFETDPKTAEEMKIELGKMQGEVSKIKQIESAEYSLRRFRKEIGYGNGKDVGVFLPGSYDASVSKLGDGPHKKAVKAVKWNQRKYDQWLEDMASNGGAENAFDMAQNAKNERGLIDWVRKQFRGEDPLQRIQWDIEAFVESVVTEGISKDRMVNQIKRALKDGTSIFKLPMDTQKYYYKNKSDFESVVTEVNRSFVSGTSGRTLDSLEARKYELNKPVKGVKIGSFTNQTLPKGTIIHNLPGGVFAMHRELEDKFKLTYSSQAPRWNHTFGVLVTSLSDTLEAIENNSKILESTGHSSQLSRINESVVTEAKDNLYLQLHKKYAEQIKGLKAGKIKKLTDLVSVQRWSMEDREDYFEMDSNKKKELSAEYNEERKLFKKYIAGDESVMLPKGTEALAESNVNESEIIYNQFDFEGMWAQKLGMTREEYVAHFATMTAGVDEAKLKDIKGKQFEVKGANFTYVEQTGRFYGLYLYDVAKTSNVADRLKLSSITDANEFLALHGITEQLPYRYDEKELDVICKKLAKQGIVCDHNDNFDVS
jgi:hypothetical protein